MTDPKIELDEAVALMEKLGLMSWDMFFEMRSQDRSMFQFSSPDERAIRQSGRTTRIILKGVFIAQREKARVYFKGATHPIGAYMVRKAQGYARQLRFNPGLFKLYDERDVQGMASAVVLYDHTCFSLP